MNLELNEEQAKELKENGELVIEIDGIECIIRILYDGYKWLPVVTLDCYVYSDYEMI